MFPLRDDIPARRIPFVNYTLIGMCAAAFLAQISAADPERFILQYGMIPARVTHNQAGPLISSIPVPQQLRNGEVRIVQQEVALPALTIAPWMTMFTCMFLHGGMMHIVGNLWFLIIFGDNVEDRYGHLPYLVMYLISGLVAGLLQILSDPASTIPTVGASGAIAGVMGAYLVLYPHARVVTLIPLGIIWQTALLPAPLFLGVWFLFQFASAAMTESGAGGVAFWAHVGGFVCGAALTWWGRQSGWLAPPPRTATETHWPNQYT